MPDTWTPDPATAQRPLGEVLFDDLDLEVSITTEDDELATVPATMELNDDQRAMIRFLDTLNWSGLTIERKRTYYAYALADVVKKRSGRKY